MLNLNQPYEISKAPQERNYGSIENKEFYSPEWATEFFKQAPEERQYGSLEKIEFNSPRGATELFKDFAD